ncbi:MucBP domain-containing protein [Levilactobacillus huananensis]|uniref:MucBP domain-containing protein n=1 Tax=Levilactobacillus huananensis TaxID=2486019 RepID=UPI0013DE1CF6|nr:MucBP domain-containing protein [Levilactobacillus huananensis]
MKTDQKKARKQYQNRWLLTSAVALTLGTVGFTTEVAHADTSTGTGDSAGQTVSGQEQQQQQAVLRKTSAPVSQSESDPTEAPASDADPSTPKDDTLKDEEPGEKTAEDPVEPAKKVTEESSASDQNLETTPKPTEEQQSTGKRANTLLRSMPVPEAATPTVDDLIPDKNLQQVVLYAIQQTHPEITSVSQINTDLLGELTKIDLWSNDAKIKQQDDRDFYNAVINIKSLEGLQYAKKLTTLAILPDATASKNFGKVGQHGQLSDISALKGLTQLTNLNLSWNQITDADTPALADLTNLTSLNLSYNDITDLSFMSKLTALNTINFSQPKDSTYKVTSLKPLAKLVKLSNISFSYNNISDLSPLRNITADPGFMTFTGNHIFDITPLLGLNWQPFLGSISYMISAGGQTWTSDQVVLNPNTTKLSMWSFAYDNLYNFNEFMDGDVSNILTGLQSTGKASSIGASRWWTWHNLTTGPDGTGYLYANWDSSRHSDLSEPEAPNGMTFNGTVTVPYTLDASVGAVTVAYQLDGGVKIAPFTILSGKTGSTLDVLNDPAIQKAIADLEDRGFAYEKPVKYVPNLTATSESSSVTYDGDAQNITLLFSPLQKIYLVDENGNAIGDKVIKESGKTNTVWNVTLPKIDGYDFDRVEGDGTLTDQNLSGTIQDINHDIYVYYKANGKPVTPVDPGQPVTDGTVTVHYQTAAGKQLAPDDTLTGTVGQAYTTTPKKINGYKLVTASANANGVYTSASQDVIYTYQAVENGGKPAVVAPTKPTKPTKPAKPAAGGQADKVTGQTVTKPGSHGGQAVQLTTGNNQAKSPATQATTLPQTNDRQVSSWWGLALLAVIGSLFGFKRSKRSRQD